MPDSNDPLDNLVSSESPALQIDRGEPREDVTTHSSTGCAWLGDSQEFRSVLSTAGSIKSDTIHSTDADAYSFREEWDLGGSSSERATSRKIDRTTDEYERNNWDNDEEPGSSEGVGVCHLEAAAASTSDTKALGSLADEVEVDTTLKGLESRPELDEDASDVATTPSLTPSSPRTSRTNSTEPIACEVVKEPAALSSDGNAFADSCTSTEMQEGESRRIQVLVRVRPIAGNLDDKAVVAVSEQGTSIQVQSSTSHGSLAGTFGVSGSTVTECAFNRVFATSATQEDVFSAIEPSVRAAMDGYNATVFAYGQTGTGKTHTLFGKDFGAGDAVGIAAPRFAEEKEGSDATSHSARSLRLENDESPPASSTPSTWGIVPRALHLLLSHAARLEAEAPAATATTDRVHVSLHCSFVQIYNDRLFDLFTDRRRQKPLLLREQPRADGTMNVVVPGLSSERILSVAHALQLMQRGLENRSVRETEANLASSRSHAIVQVNITLERSCATGDRTTRTSRLNLVDLAGSEKWNTETPMDEAHSLELKNINTSLSALGNCIAALAEPGRKHIPYRDSTLTRVLQDSLGGNTQSCLIATVSPSLNASDETIRTLQFADRARSVMQSLRINETSAMGGSTTVMMTTELLIARSQIAKLREKLDSAQRRHHETRLKELEATHRKFSDALKDKDREISKLARENAGFLKWKDEDARRIRELEAQVRELEKARASKDQQISESAALNAARALSDRVDCAADERSASGHDSDGDDSSRSRTAAVTDTKFGEAMRTRRKDSMQRLTSKADLPRLTSGRSKETPQQGLRTYKQLLERYTLQPDKARLERGAELRDRLPSATRQPEQTPAYEVQSSSASRSPHTPPSLSPLKGASYSVSSPLLPMATRIPRVASISPRGIDIVASKEGPSSGSLAARRSISSLSPRLMGYNEQQSLCETGVKPIATTSSTDVGPTHYSSSVWGDLNRAVPNVARDSTEARISRTTSTDAQATALTAAGVCAKHSLRGCVLCSVVMDNGQSRLPAASPFGSSLILRPQGEISTNSSCLTNSDEPCARHRLVRCFICCKGSDGERFGKPLAVYPGESVSSSTSWRADRPAIQFGNSAMEAATKAAVAASATASATTSVSASKCSAHSLSNCILCGNKNASSNNSNSSSGGSTAVSSSASMSEAVARTAQTLPAAYAGYPPPRRYSLDAGISGLPLSLSSASSLYSHSSASPMLFSESNGTDLAMPRYSSIPERSLYAGGSAQYPTPGMPPGNGWTHSPA